MNSKRAPPDSVSETLHPWSLAICQVLEEVSVRDRGRKLVVEDQRRRVGVDGRPRRLRDAAQRRLLGEVRFRAPDREHVLGLSSASARSTLYAISVSCGG